MRTQVVITLVIECDNAADPVEVADKLLDEGAIQDLFRKHDYELADMTFESASCRAS